MWTSEKYLSNLSISFGPAPPQIYVGDFVVYIFDDSAGHVIGGFFWALFPPQK